ncbi:MAG: hypothetical protein LIP10_07460 [Clostridiales bacterium]|nr:hypothetical protein [Clostridiales bacterium]
MNNTYRKPLILAENELAEGVYTASGSGTWYQVRKNLSENWGSYHYIDVYASGAWSITLKISGTATEYRLDTNGNVITGSWDGGSTITVSSSSAFTDGTTPVTFGVYVGGEYISLS